MAISGTQCHTHTHQHTNVWEEMGQEMWFWYWGKRPSLEVSIWATSAGRKWEFPANFRENRTCKWMSLVKKGKENQRKEDPREIGKMNDLPEKYPESRTDSQWVSSLPFIKDHLPSDFILSRTFSYRFSDWALWQSRTTAPAFSTPSPRAFMSLSGDCMLAEAT